MSQGSEVVQRKAVGSLEFNLKSEMIGYILKVWSGNVILHQFTER